MADIIMRVQGSPVAAWADDIGSCLQAIYGRKEPYWCPAPQEVASWLTRMAKLRADGAGLEAIVGYLRQLDAGEAFTGLENGVSLEYAAVL